MMTLITRKEKIALINSAAKTISWPISPSVTALISNGAKTKISTMLSPPLSAQKNRQSQHHELSYDTEYVHCVKNGFPIVIHEISRRVKMRKH